MLQLLLSLAITASATASPQVKAQTISIARVQWSDVIDRRGNHQTVPIFSLVGSPPQNVRLAFARELAAVANLDEEFRVANLAKDTQTLSRILSDDYFGTNQDGNSRNKTQFLELFQQFPIKSLQTTAAIIRSAGNVVILTGTQVELNATGTDRMLFTRVYRDEGANDWKLLSSTQFRVP